MTVKFSSLCQIIQRKSQRIHLGKQSQIPSPVKVQGRSQSQIIGHHNIPRRKTDCSTRQMDPVQESLLSHLCIATDNDDNPIRSATKMDCHLMKNINEGLLHRAFSVFLFNSHKELLLQQRSDAKITFPGYFTNTCCSHPSYTEEEMEETNAIGIKRAAQRRLTEELGIRKEQLPLDAFVYLTRIHYMAPYNEKWGEHEIDYILFIQKDVDVFPNKNEVKSYCYVAKDQLKEFLGSISSPVTPWFSLIMNKFLYQWWDNLDNLNKFIEHKTIHRMIEEKLPKEAKESL